MGPLAFNGAYHDPLCEIFLEEGEDNQQGAVDTTITPYLIISASFCCWAISFKFSMLTTVWLFCRDWAVIRMVRSTSCKG